MMTTIILTFNRSTTITSSKVTEGKPVKAEVLLYRFDDDYIYLVRENLEKIQKENEEKIEFIFYDSKNDQSIQNDIIDALLKKMMWIFY